MARRCDNSSTRWAVLRPLATRIGAVTACALMVSLGLTACSGSDDSSSEAAAPEAAADGGAGAPAVAEGGDAAVAAGDKGVSGGVLVGQVSGSVQGRRIVTVDLSVETDDVVVAAGAARAIAARSGGFVANEFSAGGDRPSATLTLRVPVDGTDSVVEELAALGDEASRSSQAQDVEATLVDLESRLDTQRASIRRLQALIDDAADLSDIILLEGELQQREADLESLDAQRAALADQAALSTITVAFSVPEVSARISGGFVEGFVAGWRALVAAGSLLLIVIGAVLPFAIAVAVVVGVVIWIVRAVRRRRRRPESTPSVEGL